MKRNETINLMVRLANILQKAYSYELCHKIWSICSDWNSEHPDEEILMCEHANDDNIVDGFYIEDDYWVFND